MGWIYSFLAFTRFFQGDLPGAEAEAARWKRSEPSVFRTAPSVCASRADRGVDSHRGGELNRGGSSPPNSAGKQYDFEEWVMVGWTSRERGAA